MKRTAEERTAGEGRGATPGPQPALRISVEAALSMRAEIERAGGREVSFLLEVGPGRILENPRAVARGSRSAVLAAARDARSGEVMVHNHPSGDLEPSEADLAVAAALYEAGLGTAITDNSASRLFVVVEPPAPRVRVRLRPEQVEEFFGPEGALQEVLPGFETREGQREMAVFIARRYNEGGVALVEAGTGTGKSLAYLLPAALWAIENGERTVVSTHTINLQEQLVGKDLPLLARALGQPLKWALVKGRGNYVSIRRARLAAETATSLFDEDRSKELAAILEWIETTDDGSLSDLAAPPSEDVWEEVRSDPDICLRSRCPHFQSCFYQRARREAAAAQILVVNHHLLFTDLGVRWRTDNFSQSAVLPSFDHLVLDEAHNAEEAATAHLGVEVTRLGLYRTLGRLDRRGKGVLADLRDRWHRHPERGRAAEHLRRLQERVQPSIQAVREALEPFLEEVGKWLPEDAQGPVRLGGEREAVLPGLGRVRESADRLLFELRRLAGELGELRARIGEDEAWAEELEGRALDLAGGQRRVEAAAVAIQTVLLPPAEEESPLVRWLEVRGSAKRPNLALAAAPVEVGPLLRRHLFARLDTCVLTSATLTTRAGFEHLKNRLGLSGGPDEEEGLDLQEAVVASPFDFSRQSLLVIPTDLADPGQEDGRLDKDTVQVVSDLARITDGGLFVLFTSHRALRSVSEGLRALPLFPYPLFIQGERSRLRLLADFVREGRGVLLGTNSFWEGVDVPGRPLRGLVLQKLPFHVPTEPLVEARAEALRSRGVDPFWRYTIPEAALRLKQGFGRLIRTRRDRGVVVVLDHRLLTRRYGRYLRDSLPPAPLVKGPWQEVRTLVRRFYEGAGEE